MGSTLRLQLVDADAALAEARQGEAAIDSRTRNRLILLLEELNVELQKRPQLALIRPACIALHNLIVTLRDPGATDDLLGAEIDAAREALRPLMVDRHFGWTTQQLQERTRAALTVRGATSMPCGHGSWTVEIVTIAEKPYPCDEGIRAFERPVAYRACSVCGMVSMHDLSALGVL
jgi:hypothetical protein